MRKLLPLLTISFVFSLCSWVQGLTLESYFPLKEGITWEYQHKILDLKTKKEIETAKSVKKNFPPMDLSGTLTVPQEFSFYEPANNLKQKVTSFIVKDKTGFYVIARQSDKEKEPKLLSEKFYILRSPIKKGDKWNQNADGFIMQDTVLSTDTTIRVPAGLAKLCIVVKRLYFDHKDLKNPFQEAIFWFAPNAGNVKVVTKNFPENKEIVQELVSFKK